jgi:hypothetical protein
MTWLGTVSGRFFCGLLLVAGAAVLAQTPGEPPPDEQDKLLASVHEYVNKYASNLPNFICDQVTRESEAALDLKHWNKGDTVIAKLSFHDGHEERTVETVNGRKVKAGASPRPLRATTEGEFGTLLTEVLGEKSEAFFKWNRWDSVANRRVVVFDFTVDKERSTMTLRAGGKGGAVVGYDGSIYADPETGAVWRIAYAAKDVPPQIETRSLSTTVDYAETQIGAKTYLLPVNATVVWLLWTKEIKNELEFRSYRKFEADTSIHYDSEANPK